MEISSDQALDALEQVQDAQRRISVLRGYGFAAPHFLLWGCIWVVGFTLWLPAARAGQSHLDAAGSRRIHREPADRAQPAGAARPGPDGGATDAVAVCHAIRDLCGASRSPPTAYSSRTRWPSLRCSRGCSPPRSTSSGPLARSAVGDCGAGTRGAGTDGLLPAASVPAAVDGGGGRGYPADHGLLAEAQLRCPGPTRSFISLCDCGSWRCSTACRRESRSTLPSCAPRCRPPTAISGRIWRRWSGRLRRDPQGFRGQATAHAGGHQCRRAGRLCRAHRLSARGHRSGPGCAGLMGTPRGAPLAIAHRPCQNAREASGLSCALRFA